MSEDVQEYVVQAEMDGLQELTRPDPDPDMLPALRPDLELQEQTAGHLIRAILKADSSVEALEAKRDADLLAWSQMIQVQKDRVASWRACVRDWMLRNDIEKLNAPWFVAFLQKGKRRLSWEDENKVIDILDALGAKEAVKTVRTVRKKELQVVFDTVPHKFDGVVKEETGETGLVIRRRDA